MMMRRLCRAVMERYLYLVDSNDAWYQVAARRNRPPIEGAGKHYNGSFVALEPLGLADTSASARQSARFTSAVARGLRESAIIALAVLALVIFVALATYSPDDTAYTSTGNSSV